MLRDDLSTIVARELRNIPRGSYAQNMYRMVYQQARLNGLGQKAELPNTAQAAHQCALETVRENHPDFVPLILNSTGTMTPPNTFGAVCLTVADQP